MRLFEEPRRVQPEPTFQIHLELTAQEVQRLQAELRSYTLPGTSAYVLQGMVRNINPH